MVLRYLGNEGAAENPEIQELLHFRALSPDPDPRSEDEAESLGTSLPESGDYHKETENPKSYTLKPTALRPKILNSESLNSKTLTPSTLKP